MYYWSSVLPKKVIFPPTPPGHYPLIFKKKKKTSACTIHYHLMERPDIPSPPRTPKKIK